MEGLIEALKSNNGYSYIAENYYKLTKEELKDCLLECLYNLDKDQLDLVSSALSDNYEI